MSRHDFGHIPVQECEELMVLIDPAEFPQEPKYFEWGISKSPDMYLRAGALEKLRAAQKKLPAEFTLKLWDCYRSREVQQRLFDQCKQKVRRENPKWDEEHVFQEARKFIAIPDRVGEVPPHNTGGTVDLTIVNETGEELNLGTDFDEFKDECHPFFFREISDRTPEHNAIMRNRDTLFAAMIEAGFRQDTDEWWHFDYGNQLWALELKKPHAIYGSADTYLP